MIKDFDILIVGGGPAGIATWLFLNQHSPELAVRTLLIEQSIYPRSKLCGGGISTPGRSILDSLSFNFDFEHLPINNLRICLGTVWKEIKAPPGFVIVDRSVFDHALAKEAVKRGLQLHQDESFIGFARNNEFLEVKTNRAQYKIKALVGADGAKSEVRRRMNLNEPSRICRLLELISVRDHPTSSSSNSDIAEFDFSPLFKFDLQGYVWNFPCIVDSIPGFNLGIFDSRIYPKRPKPALREILEWKFQDIDYPDDAEWKSHPMRYFSEEATFSQENILLTGDAVGVEPALGEGISVSLGYGKIASNVLAQAFHRKDFSFSGYKQAILRHPLGKALGSQVNWARKFYANDENSMSHLCRYFCF